MKNNIKKPLNSLNDIDKKILPFFSSPIILKRISDQKKNIDLNPQKKLIYKIIKLNEKLVKFTTSIKKYNLNLDSFFLPSLKDKEDVTLPLQAPARDQREGDLEREFNLPKRIDMNVRNNSEFILFIRNNLYYNLKFRLSNILYKIEKFIPILKFNSLLNNIYLFVPKRLLKPQPYIRFTYRIIQINNYFKNSESVNNLFTNYNSILPASAEEPSLLSRSTQRGKGQVSHKATKSNKTSASLVEKTRQKEKVLIKINNYNDQSSYDSQIIQLHKFENGRSIKYILLKLNNLLNEIENLIKLKNKLIKITSINNLSNFVIRRNLKNSKIFTGGMNTVSEIGTGTETGVRSGEGSTSPSYGLAEYPQQGFKQQGLRHSNQSVKNLRLEIKKINSYNNIENIETSPFSVVAGTGGKDSMVKENILKTKLFNVEKDIINENSNPVDLLYFNNNIKKPAINQYIKSMSTYNMITNGTILYYSNIIGFNFKKRIRTYLPFIKSVQSTVLSLNAFQLGNNNSQLNIRSGERLTSPYTFRGLKKVVGSLDKGKFNIFGRGIENNKLINNIYKFLYLSFKSMYCLISKPVFIIKSNKIIIQLFYFLLIPKIFKHIKSKRNYKSINKKKIYQDFVEKKKKLALASLFEARLKEKEDALKVKYFGTLQRSTLMLELSDGQNAEKSFKGEQVNSSNISTMNLDPKSVQFLIQSYNNELLKIRKNEEIKSGVNFDKFGRVKFKSLENKLIQKGLLKTKNKNFIKINNKNNKIKKGLKFYKLFFKRFEFNNNDLHILRIPRKWAASLDMFKQSSVKNSPATPSNLPKHSYLKGMERMEGMEGQSFGVAKIEQRPHQFISGRRHQNKKLFKFLALTYLNIFKFKVSHPLLNRLKLKLKWFQKELIKEKSNLFSYNNTDLAIWNDGKGKKRRNKFNSYNKFNWFLFKKLFLSIRLSKKIIPNAKILQKLGIPQWSWPYSGIKKKGYAASLSFTKGRYAPYVFEGARPFLSYSWPFSLLMSPTIININKKVNIFNNNLNSKLGEDSLSLSRTAVLQNPVLQKEGEVRGPGLRNAEQKENQYKIRELSPKRELYTKRYHLMKLANFNLIKIYPLKFEKLCEVLNSIFNKPVELDLIRLHYPYHDSNILVRLLAFMINKMRLRRITRRLFHKAVVKSIKKINNKDQVNIIPAFLSGMTIKVAGRLMKYRVIPRKTVKIVRRGSSSIGKINYSDISRYTNKNKRGSFTITIKSGQNFIN